MSPCREHSEHSGSSHLSQEQNNDLIFLYTATIVPVINMNCDMSHYAINDQKFKMREYERH
jgi:hypothetical protein